MVSVVGVFCVAVGVTLNASVLVFASVLSFSMASETTFFHTKCVCPGFSVAVGVTQNASVLAPLIPYTTLHE